MSLAPVLADVMLASAARGAGTYVSGAAAASGLAAVAVLTIHASATSGTPTLDASLEQSPDGASWSAVAGSSITQLTAAGNRVATAAIVQNYVRVTSAVAGTTPSVTYSAALLIIPA